MGNSCKLNIYPEFKEIAQDNEKRHTLVKQLAETLDLEGLDLTNATLISGCVERDGFLYNREGKRIDNSGNVDDNYYCFQHTGYLEDDFYGTIYFATDEPGTFVAIPFSSY